MAIDFLLQEYRGPSRRVSDLGSEKPPVHNLSMRGVSRQAIVSGQASALGEQRSKLNKLRSWIAQLVTLQWFSACSRARSAPAQKGVRTGA